MAGVFLLLWGLCRKVKRKHLHFSKVTFRAAYDSTLIVVDIDNGKPGDIDKLLLLQKLDQLCWYRY